MMMHFLTLIFRTILMYFVIYLTMRVMGKREIGKLSIFDLVISIMIAEIAVFVLEDMKRPLYDGLIPMLTLVLVQILIAYMSLKSREIRLLFEGKPSILVSRGRLNRSEMRRQRYNLDDLMMQLRTKNLDSVADVEFAILETSGQLTIIPKDPQNRQQEYQSSQPEHLRIDSSKIKYESLPLPLIMDGKVQDANLQQIKKTRFWLKNQIHAQGIKDFKDVFLCSIDHKGKLYIDSKHP
ncbi:uncharacterized membrane protein YcaP (DUF421 family) [Paenibacillus sediminis]|uniref:Uncharacterized membrane protein YcaP (DUF421 family) n=2 Tax=Paenibacillus sediminis TaxID=664909 RepID=A0ABS4GY10_9BACL|nr:uncharacterized membrane protein YcaP (DUF421 family) [Paenibacillus sediminis]